MVDREKKRLSVGVLDFDEAALSADWGGNQPFGIEARTSRLLASGVSSRTRSSVDAEVRCEDDL